ncbi:MAG: MmcQ/YjbR family DNA-binding protein [Fimbriimonadaceae bacterium]
MDGGILVKVREICLGLPDVVERLSHGEPCWFYKGKRVICMFDDHHHGADRVAVWVPCLPGVAAGLVASSPWEEHCEGGSPHPHSLPEGEGGVRNRFFVPPYVGVKGWVGVVLDEGTNWGEVRDLIEVAWRIVSGK